jgi:hypothetical protein
VSAFHEIYLRELNPARPVLAFLESEFGWTFQEYGRAGVLVTVTEEASIDYQADFGLDDSSGLPFELHRSLLTFRGRNGEKELEYRVARGVYEALVASGDYSCFLMFDAQRLLAKNVVRKVPPGPGATLVASLAEESPGLSRIVHEHLEENEDILPSVVLRKVATWYANTRPDETAETADVEHVMQRLADAYRGADADLAQTLEAGLIHPLGRLGARARRSGPSSSAPVLANLPEPIGSAVDRWTDELMSG